MLGRGKISDRDHERIPPSSGGGRADTWPVCRWIHARGPRWHGCYGLGEMPSPNHKGWRTGGGSHGGDTESDGALLAGPQPYEGDKREFPRCVAGSLRVRVGTEGRRLPESDGRSPPPEGGGGGQSVFLFGFFVRFGDHIFPRAGNNKRLSANRMLRSHSLSNNVGKQCAESPTD
jgi:hypothetical protein